MKKRVRLRRRSDFSTAVEGRRFHSGSAMVGFAVPARAEDGRVGVTVSRAIRKAVDRNRARRRLREVCRLELLGGLPSAAGGIRYDVVLIARRRTLDAPFAELRAEASLAALRLSRLNA